MEGKEFAGIVVQRLVGPFFLIAQHFVVALGEDHEKVTAAMGCGEVPGPHFIPYDEAEVVIDQVGVHIGCIFGPLRGLEAGCIFIIGVGLDIVDRLTPAEGYPAGVFESVLCIGVYEEVTRVPALSEGSLPAHRGIGVGLGPVPKALMLLDVGIDDVWGFGGQEGVL